MAFDNLIDLTTYSFDPVPKIINLAQKDMPISNDSLPIRYYKTITFIPTPSQENLVQVNGKIAYTDLDNILEPVTIMVYNQLTYTDIFMKITDLENIDNVFGVYYELKEEVLDEL